MSVCLCAFASLKNNSTKPVEAFRYRLRTQKTQTTPIFFMQLRLSIRFTVIGIFLLGFFFCFYGILFCLSVRGPSEIRTERAEAVKAVFVQKICIKLQPHRLRA